MKNKLMKRLVALSMAVIMVLNMNIANAFAGEVGGDESYAVSYEKLDADEVSADLFNTDADVEEDNSEVDLYDDTDSVRVMIVLDEAAAMSVAEETDENFAMDAEVRAYRDELEQTQEVLAEEISDEVLDGEELEVIWNLTLVANAISANVEYGKIDEIEAMDGVAAVIIEKQFDPMTTADTSNIVAQEMTGAATIKNETGYTGAGRRVAIIDTGTDTDHQSFAEGGYEYSLAVQAGKLGMTYDEYVESLDLLTIEKIDEVLEELNCYKGCSALGFDENNEVTAEDFYISSKLPFNYNYVDRNFYMTHDDPEDANGEHGSHVAGITTANTYIESKAVYDYNGDEEVDEADAQALMDYAICGTTIENEEYADINNDGVVSPYDVYVLLTFIENDEYYVSAESTVGVTGVAPDAQLITMKVFGIAGGAWTADYMAATEDAIVLGCDVANLSLGGAWTGFVDYHTGNTQDEIDYINNLMDSLDETSMVMAVAAGNDGNWADYDEAWGYMYTFEGGTSTVGEPSTYANAMSVASVDNIGLVADNLTEFYDLNGSETVDIRPSEVLSGYNNTWKSLDTTGGEGTEYDVVFLGDPGALFAGEEQTDERIYAATADDFADVDYEGKVVLVARGNGVYFSDKHINAATAGAAAVIIYNNVPGSINPSIAGSEELAPCGSVSYEQAQAIYELCEDKDGVLTAKMKVTDKLAVDYGTNVEYMTMSSFSSWGTTGDLTIKPEITAPGGNIYSVNGMLPETDGYEWMSGTSMATPHLSGLVALADQYFVDKDVLAHAKEVSGNDDLTLRTLAQSLLMSTAQPIIEADTDLEYSVRNQGAGLANIQNVVEADSFIMVDGYEDGKVKAELGDGVDGWSFTFTVNNLANEAQTFDLDATIMTTATAAGSTPEGYYGETLHILSLDQMEELGADVTYTGDKVSNGSVEVAANGTATVTVSIDITDEAVAKMMEDYGYVNGFYVEGYVYVTPDAGVPHSIPLLGWYGNWGDLSMYDVGSYIDYAYGTLDHPSHIYSEMKNALTWEPTGYGAGFYYSGNIYGGMSEEGMIGDQSYIEARNAFNSEGTTSWNFYAIFPTLIRNAVDVKLEVTDTETGEVYYVEDYEDFDNYMIASFFYDAYGAWYDTTSEYGLMLDWDYTDLEGNPLPDGTQVEIALWCAPEYFVNEDGTTDWSKVGEGSKLGYKFTVDNTFADVAEVENPFVLNTEDGEMTTLDFVVQDNNYVAAVILLDGAASEAVQYYYPDMAEDERGNVVNGSFDMSEYASQYGMKANIVICDYAGNETYYTLNLGGEGNAYGDFFAMQYDPNGGFSSWVSFDADVNTNETKVFTAFDDFVAAEYVNGYVFAQNERLELYAIPYADMLANTVDYEATYVTTLSNLYQDFAYDYSTGKLLALQTYEDEWGVVSAIWEIDLSGNAANGYEDMYPRFETFDKFGFALACEADGTIYLLAQDAFSEEETANLYTAEYGDYDVTYVGSTGLNIDYLQSMTFNHNDGQLYWARFYPVTWLTHEIQMVQIDTATAEAMVTGTLTGETACLMAPLTEETAAKDEYQNVPTIDPSVVGTPVIANEKITMNLGVTTTLKCGFTPWYTEHRDVTWSSTDEAVATVDENGSVTAVGVGECVIKVTSVEDPTLYDECTIIVSALTLNIEGYTSYTEGGLTSVGNSSRYSYSINQGVPSMNVGDALVGEGEFSGFGLQLASSVEARDAIYACEWGNTGMIYKINKETGAIEDMFQPIDGDMMFGLSYSENTDMFTGVMNYMLYVDQPITHEAEEEIINSYDETRYEFTWHKIDMSEYLNASQGNLVTNETSNATDIVFSGITQLEGEPQQYLYTDYLGQSGYGGMYTPDTTLVLLDNVGRLWYIDEVCGLQMDEYGEFYVDPTGETETSISATFNGVFTQEYASEVEGEASTYSVFVIRQIVETPLHDMFLADELGITYHFSSLYYAGNNNNGQPMFVMSLYDYWNEGTTNELFLYIPDVEICDASTGWEWVTYPGAFYDLGTTGFGNIIATIHHAEILGGLPGVGEETETTAAENKTLLFKSFYR